MACAQYKTLAPRQARASQDRKNDLQGAKHGSEASELVKLRDTTRPTFPSTSTAIQDYLHFNEIP